MQAMASQPRSTGVPVDSDGVRIERGTRGRRVVGLAAVAAALVTAAALIAIVVIRMAPRERVPPGTNSEPMALEAPAPPPVARPEAPPVARPAPAPPANVVASAERPVRPAPPAKRPEAVLPSVVPPLIEVGEPGTGIQVFPPPGTKPIKRGIVVPDDFVLPPGYVRHYQSSDDGRQLPPILMFHPDFQPKGENGEVLPIPSDRVVPPEMAPPGMPVKILDLPAKPPASD
jgi:hypothetical protein